MKKINNRIVGEVKSKPTKLYWSGRHVHGIECLCKECNKAIPTKDNCNCTESRKMPINGKLMCMDCNREVKDNWIKAFEKLWETDEDNGGWYSPGNGGERHFYKVQDFISQVEKDAIEKTNKRWRNKLDDIKADGVTRLECGCEVMKVTLCDKHAGFIPLSNLLEDKK